jgi:hypothetical protein
LLIDEHQQAIEQAGVGIVVGTGGADMLRDLLRLVTRVATSVAARQMLGVTGDRIAISVDDRG